MRKEVIGICPVCTNKLIATRLTCQSCQTEISGEFELSRFSNLSKEDLYFVETFVKVYGNIKEMEKELNVSYPTVKKNLDSIVKKMGYIQKIDYQALDDDVLERLQKKEISVEEALKLLKR